MNRNFLRWFYVAVQFVMLAVSIPKVAMLFHAYDVQTMGPLLGGVDLRSWFVGVAIDLTAACTSWAAMYKFGESSKRSTLIAPGFIILVCTGLSVIANYEDAATLRPEQYAGVSLFSQPALLINPILISAPPVLVFLLILLVPSVLAQPRIKTAKDIAAEAAQSQAQITAKARLREAKAKANAKVRGAQVAGLADTANAIAERVKKRTSKPIPEPEAAPPTKPRQRPETKPTNAPWGQLAGFDEKSTIPIPTVKVSHTHPLD
jgi:hypothetical protein